MNKIIAALTTLTVFLATSEVAVAVTQPIPEPNILSLLTAGGVVGVIVAIRKRRK